MMRRVNGAMDARRPAKSAIRRLWLDALRQCLTANQSTEIPLYLTLPGREGLDIEMLSEAGIVERTEVNGIAKDDQWKVIAVESSTEAVINLQTRFPGLKILSHAVDDLLRGASPIRWPTGEHERYCRARVVNLDLNRQLRGEATGGSVTFPVLGVIKKIAQLHAMPDPIDWWLLLTLHGDLDWSQEIARDVQEFLSENCDREPVFGQSVTRILGNHLAGRILGRSRVNFRDLKTEEKQLVLNLFVPKKISALVQDQLWRIDTEWNLRYGGLSQAPMVSWVMSFKRGHRASGRPDALYRENLRDVARKVAKIEEDGSFQA
jgi:hypothetical protein